MITQVAQYQKCEWFSDCHSVSHEK